MQIPTISIIVPAYNAEKTIKRCLDSLLIQTIQVEIIVIDDGSTDETSIICQKYVKENNNIIYKRQNNKGVSAARNYGLREAHGKYIGFVDSDDYVRKDMFKLMTDPLENDDSLSISINSLVTNKKQTIRKGYDDIVRDILCSSKVRGYPWNKVFRRNLIDRGHLLFREDLHDMEDKLFCIEYMNLAKGGGIEIQDNLYYYNYHDEGVVTAKRYGLERYKTGLNACEAILNVQCVSSNNELRRIQEAITVKHCIQIARACMRSSESVSLYQKKTREYYKSALTSNCLSIKQKIGMTILLYCPILLKYI